MLLLRLMPAIVRAHLEASLSHGNCRSQQHNSNIIYWSFSEANMKAGDGTCRVAKIRKRSFKNFSENSYVIAHGNAFCDLLSDFSSDFLGKRKL